ncbi:sulfotransferase family 2 domain-containing protein [Microcoleus sp. D3_18a_C4]|uniref:sulfotransferase family 2 domain-containing protein n=1 Tax=Microcoleus sp. D3_18a_C4 TaxID=3055332 RepID=UPI002FD596EF
MKRSILIHHHIFKNAGTSFNYALNQAFGKQFMEYDLPGGQLVSPAILEEAIQANPQVKAISGHHIAMPTPQGEDFQTISSVLIRKPLSRIRSIYNFEHKQKAETAGAIKAKELDFKGFVLWRLETSPIVFCNYQTYYCSRTELMKPKYSPTEADLKLAIENLKSAAIVGTVEQYNETLAIAQTCLQKSFEDAAIALAPVSLNISSKGVASDEEIRNKLVKDLGEDLVARLEEMNQLDNALYQVVSSMLKANLQA